MNLVAPDVCFARRVLRLSLRLKPVTGSDNRAIWRNPRLKRGASPTRPETPELAVDGEVIPLAFTNVLAIREASGAIIVVDTVGAAEWCVVVDQVVPREA